VTKNKFFTVFLMLSLFTLLLAVSPTVNSGLGDEVLDQSQEIQEFDGAVAIDKVRAQNYSATCAIQTKIELYIKRYYSSFNLIFEIRKENASSLPDLTEEGLVVTLTKTSGQVSTSYSWIEFDHDDFTVTESTYFILLWCFDDAGSWRYEWGYTNDVGAYDDGMYLYSDNNATTWTVYDSMDYTFRTYGYPLDDNVILDSPEDEILDQSQEESPSSSYVRETVWGAQGYSPTVEYQSKIAIKADRFGTPPDNAYLEIRTDDGTGKPSSTVVVSMSLSYDNFLEFSSNSWVEFDHEDFEVTEEKYHICLSSPSSDGSNYYDWFYSTSDVYDGGTYAYSSDSGSSWTTVATYDFTFKTYAVSENYEESENATVEFAFTPDFNVTDPINATFYSNITGAWESTEYIGDVTNFEQTSFNYTFTEAGTYLWNIGVFNNESETIFSDSNYTITLNDDSVISYLPVDADISENMTVTFTFEPRYLFSEPTIYFHTNEVNWTTQHTVGDITNFSNSTYDYTFSANGTYIWGIEIVNVDEESFWSTNRTINIDVNRFTISGYDVYILFDENRTFDDVSVSDSSIIFELSEDYSVSNLQFSGKNCNVTVNDLGENYNLYRIDVSGASATSFTNFTLGYSLPYVQVVTGAITNIDVSGFESNRLTWSITGKGPCTIIAYFPTGQTPYYLKINGVVKVEGNHWSASGNTVTITDSLGSTHNYEVGALALSPPSDNPPSSQEPENDLVEQTEEFVEDIFDSGVGFVVTNWIWVIIAVAALVIIFAAVIVKKREDWS